MATEKDPHGPASLTIENVYGGLSFLADWRVIGLLLLLGLLCEGEFALRGHALGPGNDTPDSKRWGYTPEQVHDWLDRIGEPGRQLYAQTQVTLDLVFPLAYAGLWAGLLARWWSCVWARRLVWAPVLAVFADYAENFQTAYLAWTFTPGHVSPLAWGAAVATCTKWALVALSVLLVGVGGLSRLCGWTRPEGG
jgi:hypothetical protein